MDSQVQQRGQSSALSVVGKAVLSFAQRHYIVTSLYILGLFLVQFGVGFAASREANDKYDTILSKVLIYLLFFSNLCEQIDHQSLNEAQKEYLHSRERYNSLSGFFSCDDKCQVAKKKVWKQGFFQNFNTGERTASFEK